MCGSREDEINSASVSGGWDDNNYCYIVVFLVVISIWGIEVDG